MSIWEIPQPTGINGFGIHPANKKFTTLEHEKELLKLYGYQYGGLIRDRAVKPTFGIGKHTFDPETPNLYRHGGLVKTTHLGRPPNVVYMKIKTCGVDQVPTLLQQGEIVIPKKYTDKVAKYLKKEKIHLSGL